MAGLSGRALTTLQAVKDELAIPESDTARDAALERLINAASDVIRRYCNRDFSRVDRTEEHDGTGRPALILELTPIVEVASVTVKARPVDPDEYVVRPDAGMLVLKRGVWPECGFPHIEVAYTGGYVTPAQAEADEELERDLPHDVEEACVLAAVNRFQHMGEPSDVESFQAEQLRVQFGDGGRDGLSQSVRDLLAPYVR